MNAALSCLRATLVVCSLTLGSLGVFFAVEGFWTRAPREIFLALLCEVALAGLRRYAD